LVVSGALAAPAAHDATIHMHKIRTAIATDTTGAARLRCAGDL